MQRSLGIFFGIVALCAALLVPIGAASAATPGLTYSCDAHLPGGSIMILGATQRTCPTAGYGFATLNLGSTASQSFKGWAQVTGTDAMSCGTDAVCRAGYQSAYRWTANGWVSARLAQHSWIYAQHYSGNWEWAYQDGQWYATSVLNVQAYCRVGTNPYGNCTATVSSGYPVG